MTAHLALYEPAARIYCAMRGEDPDEQIRTPHPLGLFVEHTRPAWHAAAEHMLDISMVMVAMKQAAAVPAPVDPMQMELFPTKQ